MNSYQKQIEELVTKQKDQNERINQCYQQINWCKDTVKQIEGYLNFNSTYDNDLTGKCLEAFDQMKEINKIIIQLKQKVDNL